MFRFYHPRAIRPKPYKRAFLVYNNTIFKKICIGVFSAPQHRRYLVNPSMKDDLSWKHDAIFYVCLYFNFLVASGIGCSIFLG